MELVPAILHLVYQVKKICPLVSKHPKTPASVTWRQTNSINAFQSLLDPVLSSRPSGT